MSDQLKKLRAMCEALQALDDRPMPEFDTLFVVVENTNSDLPPPGIVILILSEPDRELANHAAVYAGATLAVEDSFEFVALARKGVPLPTDLPGVDRAKHAVYETTREFVDELNSLIGNGGPDMWRMVITSVAERAK